MLTSEWAGEQVFDKKDDDDDAVGELHQRAGEEADEGSDGGAEGLVVVVAAPFLAEIGSDEGSGQDAYDAEGPYGDAEEGEHEDGDDESDGAAAGAGLGAAEALGAPGGHDVVEHGDDHGEDAGDDEHFDGYCRRFIGDIEQQQGCPRDGWTGQSGHDGSDDAYDGEDDG